MRFRLNVFALAFGITAFASTSHAQAKKPPVEVIDPTEAVEHPVLEPALHKSLPEQYIWLASAAGTDARNDQALPRFFRYHFRLDAAPKEATLYVAGPDQIRAYLNGDLVAHGDHNDDTNTNPQVLIAGVHENLKAGDNSIAVEATGGSPLAVKIILAGEAVDAPPVAMTGPGWKATLASTAGWQKADFDDSSWSAAAALGSIEQMLGDFRHWYMGTSNLEANADSEMYRWPGYDGISPYLARMPLFAKDVLNLNEGGGRIDFLFALTGLDQPHVVDVYPASDITPNGGPPSLVLDFGRESDGRLEFVSDSNEPMRVEIQYGESLEETTKKPYLGMNEIIIPPGATVYGPKSAFRYAQVKFVAGPSPMRFKAIRLDYVYYPVQYRGSFESSDALLNRIWKIGAYTSHLCMQDAIWDAPKRDRLPWMGDLDVSGDVIDTAFADHFLMQTTLDRLNHEAGSPMHQEVNGIPGYSAFWVMGEADYYRHIGDAAYLHSIHDDIIRLLDYIAGDLDDDHLFSNPRKAWPFVDWSPEMQHDTRDARRATTFEFYRAFSEGAWMLREAGDAAAADKYQAIADAIRGSAQKMLDAQSGTFGARWQPNAMAIFSGVATPEQTAAIWKQVLSKRDGFMISPYYDFYVISAAASAGHRRETLDWIRQYWGGMVAEGATSFWEAYDPAWPKEDYHANLQADDSKGYFVSLSHGWSSGPTAWLTEQILGIRPTAGGYSKTTIRPDLAGLAWVRGAVQAPNGQIKVDYRAPASETAKFAAHIELPDGVDASVSMPVCGVEKSVLVNGAAMNGESAEDGARVMVHLANAGKYTLESNCAGK